MTNDRDRQTRQRDDALNFMVRRLLTLTEQVYAEVAQLRRQLQEVKG